MLKAQKAGLGAKKKRVHNIEGKCCTALESTVSFFPDFWGLGHLFAMGLVPVGF